MPLSAPRWRVGAFALVVALIVPVLGILPALAAVGTFSINNVEVTESADGVVAAVFTVSLSDPQPGIVTIEYATEDVTATGGTLADLDRDYMSTTGTLLFLPSDQSE